VATPERVRFRSNLMAGFGAGFVTPVNTINFLTVFDNFGEKIIDSVAVWTTIIAFFVVYIPFAVLARHLDKKDALKVAVIIRAYIHPSIYAYMHPSIRIYLLAKSAVVCANI